MVAIYFISIFIYIYYFGIGYKRFQTNEYRVSKINLCIIGALLRLFCLKFGIVSMVTLVNVGLDLVIAFLIYKFARQYYKEQKSLICASFYLFNPVILIYSCVWGKNLSLWVLFIILCVWCIQQKKIGLACILFGASFYEYIGTIFFSERMAYNACNFWGMIGWNWRLISLSPITRILICVGFIIGLIIGTLYLHKIWKTSRLGYLYIAFLISFYSYFFGIGINEYLFIPVIILGLLCFMVSGHQKAYWIYVVLSILNFCNQIYTCSLYDPKNFNSTAASMVLFSFFTLISLVVITKYLLKGPEFLLEDRKSETQEVDIKVDKIENNQSDEIQLINRNQFDKKDYGAMAVLTLIFIILSLPRLGSHQMPETAFKMGEATTKEMIIDLGEEKQVDHLCFFLGQEHAINVSISSYDEEAKQWEVISPNQNIQSVFAWNTVEVKAPIRYLGIVTNNKEAFFNELVIVGEDGKEIMPVDVDQYPELFDEQNLYKAYPTYYDQTFFDEVYHARTAFEYIQGDVSYENTHPPLGKILISLGIRVFGMNPFGWRIIVEIFGIIMIPLMYVFAKRLFKDYWIATMTTLLLTMDFMHFTLAKIATLDIIIGFFILMMYYFMYCYCQLNFMKEPLKKSLIPLGLCGITMGLGIATKWTGVYAGAGLAVLFFSYIWQSYMSYKGEKKIITKKITFTFAYCILFFMIIPAIIYCLSYIPFVGYREYNNLLDKVFDNMQLMYNYHSKLVTTHPYESRWYEWAWIKRPLYQAVTHGANGMGSAISCFGNPLVWWPGILAVLYTFKCWLWDHDKKAGFLCISYSAQLIPWMFVTRNTFIYHYFPCSLFTILCSGYCVSKIVTNYKYGKRIVWIYGILVILTFAMFYPVISGMWVNESTARLWLRWLSGWVMI